MQGASGSGHGKSGSESDVQLVPVQHTTNGLQAWPCGTHAPGSQKHAPVGVQATTPPAPSLSTHVSPLQHSLPPAVQVCETSEQVGGGVQTPPVQVSEALQQGVVVPQPWPVAAQVEPDDAQVPLVAPGGTSQESPAQQSAPTVQTPPVPTHGVRQVRVSGSHEPEQHCASVVHEAPLVAQTAQVPTVGSPADGTHTPEQQVSAADGGGMVQVSPSATQTASSRQTPPDGFSAGWQVVPLQHGSDPVAGVHSLVRGRHSVPCAAQCSTPFASGTQGAPPQH